MSDKNAIRQKNITFKLADLEKFEQKKIWMKFEKRNETRKDADGNKIDFPIDESSDVKIEGTNGNVRGFKEMTTLPPMIFSKVYPDLNVQRTILRRILVEGEEIWYEFKLSANNKLEEQIKTLRKMDKDPLNAIFKQSFDSSASPRDMYKVEFVEMDGDGESKNKDTNEEKKEKGVEDKIPIEMNDKEKKIMKTIMELGTEVSHNNFVGIFKDNDIDRERAEEFYEHYEKLEG